MSRGKKLVKSSEFATTLYDDGPTSPLLLPSEAAEELDFMTYVDLSLSEWSQMLDELKQVTTNEINRLLLSRKSISTAESRVPSKKKISVDKSIISSPNIPTTKSSKTSLVELTSEERVSTKSWLMPCKDLSQKLWLPIGTGYVGSHGNTSIGCSRTTELVSSWKINRNIVQNRSSSMTSCLSSTYSHQDTTAYVESTLNQKLKQKRIKTLQRHENMKHVRLVKKDADRVKEVIIDVDKYIIRAKRIRVSPVDNRSRKTLNDAIAVYRKLWNCCVDHMRKPDNKLLTKVKEYDLRDIFVTGKKMTPKQLKRIKWTFRISSKTRAEAIKQFASNFNTSNDNLIKSQYKNRYKKRKKGKKPKKIKKKVVMRYKSKHDKQQTIKINKEECNIHNDILTTFNGVQLRLHEDDLLQELQGQPECNLTLTRIGYSYYISVPKYVEVIPKTTTPDRIVGIDTGENIFGTYYCPDGEWGEIGIGINDKLYKIYAQQRRIKKNMQARPEGSNKNWRKAVRKRDKYIYNMVEDAHWKLAKWLLTNFKKIIIPKLYVPNCSKIRKRIQADLRHCTFVNRLIQKCTEYKDSEIHVVKEYYTSQACTRCLSLNTVKGETVRCRDCKSVTHRDLNGSRNIFMKACY